MKLKLCVLLIGTIVLFGCQINTVNLAPKFKPEGTSKIKQEDVYSCAFNLNSFVDKRKSDSLGVVANSIIKTDVNSLFLSALDFYGATENPDAPISINVYLVKAYVQSLLSSMSANVVVAVEMKSSSNQDYHSKKYYRGYDVSVNWNSGEGEIMDIINNAIIDSMAKAKKDLDRACLSLS